MKFIKKSILLFCLIFILLVIQTQALELLETEDVKNHEIVKGVNGEEYEVLVSEMNQDSFVLKQEDDHTWIKKNSCKDVRNTRFCFANAGNVSGKWVVQLKTYSLLPDIKTLESPSLKEAYVGEEIDVDITLTNVGSRPALNTSYSVIIPDGYEIVEYSFLELNGTKLSWVGNINDGNSQQLSYRFLIIKGVNRTINGTVTFLDEFGKKYFERISEMNISAGLYINYSVKLMKSKLDIDEGTLLNISIYNPYSTNVTFKPIEVILPDIVWGENEDGFRDHSIFKFSYGGTIKFNVSKNISLNIYGRKIGNDKIEVKTKYNRGSIDGEYSLFFPINTDSLRLPVQTTLDESVTYESKDDVNLEIKIKNPYGFSRMTNILLILSLANVSERHAFSDVMLPRQSVTIYNKTWKVPEVEDESIYPLDVIILYNLADEKSLIDQNIYNSTTTLDIRVAPLKRVYAKTKVSKRRIFEGDSTEFEVIIVNEKEVGINNITVNDITELLVTGETSAVLNLSALEEKEVYSYSIKAPFTSKERNFTITTFIEYKDDKGRQIAIVNTTSITVVPRTSEADFIMENLDEGGKEEIVVNQTNATKTETIPDKTDSEEVIFTNRTEEPERNNLTKIIALISAIIVSLSIFITGMKIHKRMKTSKTPVLGGLGKKTSGPESNITKVDKFILNSMEEGMTLNDIKVRLISEGYSEGFVDSEINRLTRKKAGKATPPEPEVLGEDAITGKLNQLQGKVETPPPKEVKPAEVPKKPIREKPPETPTKKLKKKENTEMKDKLSSMLDSVEDNLEAMNKNYKKLKKKMK